MLSQGTLIINNVSFDPGVFFIEPVQQIWDVLFFQGFLFNVREKSLERVSKINGRHTYKSKEY